MFPILPYLIWTGGIAAGAQVAGGVVRGAGELVRGRPGAAVLEVVDGVVGPVRLACEQLGKLGNDALHAVVGHPEPELRPDPLPPVPRAMPRRRRRKPRLAVVPSENGQAI